MVPRPALRTAVIRSFNDLLAALGFERLHVENSLLDLTKGEVLADLNPTRIQGRAKPPAQDSLCELRPDALPESYQPADMLLPAPRAR